MKLLNLFLRFFILINFVFLFSPTASHSFEKGEKEENWNVKMQRLGASFYQLVPYIYGEKTFRQSRSKKKIEELISSHITSTDALSKQSAKKKLGDDPYVFMSLTELKEYNSKALDYFVKGKYEVSQRLLQASARTCFRCHTRISSGVKGSFWSGINSGQAEMAIEDRVNMLIAMREYQLAMEEILKTLNYPKKMIKNKVARQEKLIEKAMFISIRGMNSMQKAFNLLESQKNNSDLSAYFHSQIASWKKDLIYWMDKEKELERNSIGIEKVLKISEDKIDLKSDHDFIKKLIASRILHDQIKRKTLVEKSRSYLYLGQIYDDIIDGTLWELPEVYFEACIQNQPKSDIAKKCFRYYEERVQLSFTGSRGVDIPRFARNKIRQLKVKAGL